MHLRPCLVSTVLFLLPVVHAVGINEINGANLALEEEANNGDSDVKSLNVLNAVTNAEVCPTFCDTSVPSHSRIQGIANDLARLAADVESSMENAEGTAATDDPGTEESVVDSFGAVCYLSLLYHWC